jgi:hypothetical protein
MSTTLLDFMIPSSPGAGFAGFTGAHSATRRSGGAE